MRGELLPGHRLDGTVYVGSWDKKLYAINTDSKLAAKLWEFETGGTPQPRYRS